MTKNSSTGFSFCISFGFGNGPKIIADQFAVSYRKFCVRLHAHAAARRNAGLVGRFLAGGHARTVGGTCAAAVQPSAILTLPLAVRAVESDVVAEERVAVAGVTPVTAAESGHNLLQGAAEFALNLRLKTEALPGVLRKLRLAF